MDDDSIRWHAEVGQQEEQAMNETGVYKAVQGVMRDLAHTGVGKDQKNTFDNYQFRGIDGVMNAVSKPMHTHGLTVFPSVVSRESVERSSQKGGALFYVTVCMDFRFVAVSDGSSVTVRTYGEAMDRGDKATNKAMAAAFKYALLQTFVIPTEGDNDADASSHTVKGKIEELAEACVALHAEAVAAHEKDPADTSGFWELHRIASRASTEPEKLALWEQLKAHPAVRAAIKEYSRYAAAERNERHKTAVPA